ncbi:MAG: hypothetical protein DID91_2727702742 [Candidatus Nitrotoga sp. MKT]|nr:MAG: hypothetical protein DID91_2727702742 [Candidatus Nitrotoga sp. MKT]
MGNGLFSLYGFGGIQKSQAIDLERVSLKSYAG